LNDNFCHAYSPPFPVELLSCTVWVTTSVAGSHPNRQLPSSSIARYPVSQGVNCQSAKNRPL
jgi:hypothetical protein